ncbi:MAG: hypothetical protein AB7O66_11180 [Limisphaerales bacterium]
MDRTRVRFPLPQDRRYPTRAGDAKIDSDGDGQTNREEFRAGSDPGNRESVFRVGGFERADGSLRIRFSGNSNRRFQLEKATRLEGTAWTAVGGTVRGRDGVQVVDDPSPGLSDLSFYRIRALDL